MRAVLGVLIALVFALPLRAQTINGESNYEDGLSHITPQETETRMRDSVKPPDAKDRGGTSEKRQSGDK